MGAGLFLRLQGLFYLAGRQEVAWVAKGAVRREVEPQVRHGPVEHRSHGGKESPFEVGLLLRYYGLDHLVRIVDMAELDGVLCEGPFHEVETLDATHAQAEPTAAGVGIESLVAGVLGGDHLTAGRDTHHAGGVQEEVEQPVDLVLGERRYLSAVGGVLRTGDEILSDLVAGHVHQPAVAGACSICWHLAARPFLVRDKALGHGAPSTRGRRPGVGDSPRP